MKELLLARSFAGARSGAGLGFPFCVGAVAVAIGTTFVVFSFGIYDSYVGRLEALTMSMLPQVIVMDEHALASSDPASDPERCVLVCSGETILRPTRPAGRDPGADHGLVEELRAWPGVSSAARVLWGEADLDLSGGSGLALPTHVRVLGIETQGFPLVPRLDLVIQPELLTALADGSVLVSKDLQSEWTHRSARADELTIVLEGQPVDLRIVGSFSLGLRGVTNRLVVTTIATARRLAGPRAPIFLGLSLEDPYAAARVVRAVEPGMAKRGFVSRAWTSQASQDFESLRLLRWIMLLVLGLSFLITALNLRNALSITVLERRHEIGVLRSMGVRDATIRYTFLLLALAVGVAGLAFGIPAGVGLSVVFGDWIDARLAQSALVPLSGVRFGVPLRAIAEVVVLVVGTCAATAHASVGRALRLDPVACLKAD